ncbi:OLC1v1006102C1 [Oldenlandia corymbosa var. corymbosa]|uniref:OLC1v1006102C1 n=1 Tax=Oldenlandia corymbosa var. corymbosa TaxID=529605 RepID=A0AAV1DGJ2_OLDCO|nr:OLC1v1006102C1 [Oldenlandia corymbosa var. corymbosa]
MEKPETENPSARRFSSLTVELFGAKESAPLPGKISSIFHPPFSTTMASGRRSISASEMLRLMDKRSSVGGEIWNRGSFEDRSSDKVGSSQCETSKERNSAFLDRPEPCSLSSSLVYGGAEDVYTQPSNAQSRGSYPESKKDEANGDQTRDDSHSASRGDWWQGSLYY